MNSSGGHSKRERRFRVTPCLVNIIGHWSALPGGTRYLPTLKKGWVVLLQAKERYGSSRRRMPSAGEAVGQDGQALGVAGN